MDRFFEMRLADEPFEKIWREEKTVEIRLNDEKRKEIEVGDKILFRKLTQENSVAIASVIALHRFNTFRKLFSSALFSKTGCGNMTIDSATESMYRFYSKEQEQKYGVLGIEIEYEEYLTLVYNILKDEYKDCNISDEDVRRFAVQLNNYAYIENYDLNDILLIVYEFEESMRAKGAIIEVGRQCSIYEKIVRYLDRTAANAKRLYESFLFYRDCLVFDFLMNEYEEWLTKEQRAEILSIAREVFIESVWKDYT